MTNRVRKWEAKSSEILFTNQLRLTKGCTYFTLTRSTLDQCSVVALQYTYFTLK